MLSDTVLIRRTPSVDRVGSILLAEASQQRLHEGQVIAVGPGKRVELKVEGGKLREHAYWTERPMSVQAGDRVLFSENGHQIVYVEGEELVTLREDSIVCVLESEPAVHHIDPAGLVGPDEC